MNRRPFSVVGSKHFVMPILACCVAACGGGNAPPPASAAATAAPTTSVSKSMPNVGDSAHDLAMLATACWFGGVWGDKVTTEATCMDVVKRVYGSDDKAHFEQLRAYEDAAIADVAAKVSSKAIADEKDAPNKDALVAIVKSFAAAQRELMFARRAADRIKHDLKAQETEQEKEKVSSDEAAAIAPLKKIDALSALLALDAGALKADAHALGVMTAIERAQIALTLPRHMKIFAASGPFALLFGVQPPAVPEDAEKPLVPGTWVKYVDAVAKSAGHPVADSVKIPADRLGLGWAGIYQGLAEKLRADEGQLSERGRLLPIIGHATRRLENETKALQAKHSTPPAPAATSPAKTGTPKK
jgi:hypothetical protein